MFKIIASIVVLSVGSASGYLLKKEYQPSEKTNVEVASFREMKASTPSSGGSMLQPSGGGSCG